ncbi:malate synthase A, partial [Xenorhabdus bovienii]|nr:malate synthase A [Xenorhabdus bovienii]
GAFAMGGMSAFIPSKDPVQNQLVLDKVRADKELEANNGHDGTWIAHPGLADIAMTVFDTKLGEQSNQLAMLREEDETITAAQLLASCSGERTEQ